LRAFSELCISKIRSFKARNTLKKEDRMKLNRRNLLKTGAAAAALVLTRSLDSQFGANKAAASATFESPDGLSSEVAWRWFELLYDIVKAERTPPTRASRIYGIASVTLYESIVDGSANQRSLAGQVNGLVRVVQRQDGALHWPTVANVAMGRIVRALFPTMSGSSLAAVIDLEESMNAQAPGASSQADFGASLDHAANIVSAILSWTSHDLASRSASYSISQADSAWQATPPAFATSPLDPGWGGIRPMALVSGSQITPKGHPPFSSSRGSAFYAAAEDVYLAGKQLTTEQKYIADFWADNPGASGTPPGHWIAIVSQTSRNSGLSLMRAAEAFARVGIALHDAFICCWNAKYATNLLRPVTYIRRYIDAAWLPYIATPAFPAYTSGHSSQSGAAAAVLTDMFGAMRFTDTTHVDHSLVLAAGPRTFASFLDAAAEATISRLYGGIHYAFDNDDGFEVGKRIGEAVVKRITFRTT
jgi:hypothetical protein